MPALPAFDPVTGYLPPGRFPMTWDEVEDRLVSADRFGQSTSRQDLYSQLEVHRSLVELATGAIGRLWLAGSFVSAKADPGDIDVTYLIPPDAYDRVDADPDTADQLDNLGTRDWCVLNDMWIDAYVLRLPETMTFRDLGVTGAMAKGDHEVFRRLGIYDEIWQRCREGTNNVPAGTRRGYVEVLL